MTGSPSRGWIRSPAYDLVFFSSLWMVPLLLALHAGMVGAGAGVALVVAYHALLRLPHFVATVSITWGNPANREHYRSHWVQYSAIPAALLVAYLAPALSPGVRASAIGVVLATVATLWGTHHIGMQNFGVLQIYRRRAGLPFDARAQSLERRLFQLLVALAVASPVVSLLGPGWHWLSLGARALIALAVVCVGVLLVVRMYSTGHWSVPLVAYLATSVAVMIHWPFYDRLPTPGLSAGMHFLVYNGHHCAAYLGLLFLMDGNRRERLWAGFPAGAARFASFALPLVLVSVAALLATGGLATREGALEAGLFALQGPFVVHYWIESRVWRFSNAHARKVILPLLRPPALLEPVAGPRLAMR
jgi:hypothetical protein